MKMKTCLTIAGSDSIGGAGIQADLKTFCCNGVYGMSVITAVTCQNTTGVSAIQNIDTEIVAKQIDAVFTDIVPDSVKIGMTSTKELIETIAERLSFYNAQNVVLDPVMVATSGSRLLQEDAILTLEEKLFPLAKVITPNIPEAEIISGMKISDKEDMEKAAKVINKKYGCCVLVKGGHSINDANDLLFDGNKFVWFNGKRIDNPNTHGTGCTLSSAIASNLAKGKNLEDAVKSAKNYISGALAFGLDLGKGSGPMNHAFDVKGNY